MEVRAIDERRPNQLLGGSSPNATALLARKRVRMRAASPPMEQPIAVSSPNATSLLARKHIRTPPMDVAADEDDDNLDDGDCPTHRS